MLLFSLWRGPDLGREECLQSTCLIMPAAVALRPERSEGCTVGMCSYRIPPSRAGTHGSNNPTFLCEKQDVTLPAFLRPWVCRPGVSASTADRGTQSFSPAAKPASHKREPGLLKKLPTSCFRAYLGHVYCDCLCCTKEALEMRVDRMAARLKFKTYRVFWAGMLRGFPRHRPPLTRPQMRADPSTSPAV